MNNNFESDLKRRKTSQENLYSRGIQIRSSFVNSLSFCGINPKKLLVRLCKRVSLLIITCWALRHGIFQMKFPRNESAELETSFKVNYVVSPLSSGLAFAVLLSWVLKTHYLCFVLAGSQRQFNLPWVLCEEISCWELLSSGTILCWS